MLFTNARAYLHALFTERRTLSAIHRKFSFEDEDLVNEEQMSGNEDEKKLDQLAKELAKAKKRLKVIIDTIQDQRNILLAVAAKTGVDMRDEDVTSSDGNH